MKNEVHLKKDLGLLIATALVAGNMMGSGIFMLPASLANKSGPGASMLAWILTGMGSIFLALSFAKLGSVIPRAGGPYEFSKIAFGDFMGFMNAWLYWNGSWIGNAAVVLAVTSYSAFFFPILNQSHLWAFVYTSAVLWIFTIVNILGVRRAGKVQTAITIFEVGLFLFFIIMAALHFHSGNLMPLLPKGHGLGTLSTAATMTLWAFVGLESASIAAGEIRDPAKNVKRSTILGILIVVAFYILINFFAMGAMPQSVLAKSTSPIADILAQYFGAGISRFIAIGAVVSILGTTVGWILSTARVAFAAGRDGLFPEFFGKVHPRFRTPYVSLIIGSVLINILLAMNYTKTLLTAFNFIILFATLSFLPVYASTAASEIMLLVKRDKYFSVWKFIKVSIVPLMGLIYAGWAIYGSGADTVMWGFLMMLLGVPFYLYQVLKYDNKVTAIRSYAKAAAADED
jgi:APA family basic amino acid/polyamine antiporter